MHGSARGASVVARVSARPAPGAKTRGPQGAIVVRTSRGTHEDMSVFIRGVKWLLNTADSSQIRFSIQSRDSEIGSVPSNSYHVVQCRLIHTRPFVGALQGRSWSHYVVLGAIPWAFIAKN